MPNPFLANNATPTQAPVTTPTPAPVTPQGPAAGGSGAIANVGQTPGVAKDPFAAPKGAGGGKIADALNQALVLRPTEYIPSMKTTQGVTDAIQADWIILTGEAQGTVESGLIFQTVLKKELKGIMGTPTPLMVGALYLGEAKNGNNAPYLLGEVNDEIRGLAAQACQAHNWI